MDNQETDDEEMDDEEMFYNEVRFLQRKTRCTNVVVDEFVKTFRKFSRGPIQSSMYQCDKKAKKLAGLHLSLFCLLLFLLLLRLLLFSCLLFAVLFFLLSLCFCFVLTADLFFVVLLFVVSLFACFCS